MCAVKASPFGADRLCNGGDDLLLIEHPTGASWRVVEQSTDGRCFVAGLRLPPVVQSFATAFRTTGGQRRLLQQARQVRDAQVANRPVYVAIGVNMDGERDVLGMWLGPTGGEGAKQWATMLTELRNRGIADALIVCCDGLKGLPEAIRVTWPDATVQTCVVHLVRNSLKYASKADWAPITKGLRAIYTADTVGAASVEFESFAEQWREKYPAMTRSWETTWNEFVPFLEFPVELRKIVYTTNAIESMNAASDEPSDTEDTSPTSKPR